VWAIAKAITPYLNHVVLTCVKSIKGPLVVNKHSIFTMNMETKLVWFFGGFEFFDLVEAKIFLLHISMSQEVIKVIKPFLDFLKYFDAQCVQNMFAIMLI
jgi:hypothetical protein